MHRACRAFWRRPVGEASLRAPPALIVAGPTASGKSALALEAARRLGGWVINADSMQMYSELRVLTARPGPEEEAVVPHRLYGVWPSAEAGSVARWREAALAGLRAAREAGALPILCGGTGLYLSALVRGLSELPAVPAEARAEARRLLAEEGPAALHARLAAADPGTAAALRPSDSQRLARAWEVWRGTGRGLAAWRASAPASSPAPHGFRALLLDPPREGLRSAIAARWGAMVAAGAVEEVRALLALGLDPALPAMRAHGVPEIAAALRGEIGMEEAGRRAVLAVGRYAKRQATWFRHRPLSDPRDAHIFDARFTGVEQLSTSRRADLDKFLSDAR